VWYLVLVLFLVGSLGPLWWWAFLGMDSQIAAAWQVQDLFLGVGLVVTSPWVFA
jgi:hypothetical protein